MDTTVDIETQEPDVNLINIRVIPLLPEQLDGLWEVVRFAVRVSYPTLDEDGYQQLYRDIKRGTMLCDFVVGESPEGNKALALALLQPNVDRFTGEKVLHILTLHGYRKMTTAQYQEAYIYLKRIAVSLGVKRITAITQSPTIVELFKSLGGSEATYLSLEV